MLDEFCATTGYHRKYAVTLLNHPRTPAAERRPRTPMYSARVIRIAAAIWEAAGYPWSTRLHALLPLWLPWATRRFRISPALARQLRRISPRTLDRRLQGRKRQARRRLYGRTKPGTLLKHHIPIRTQHWDVTTPGFVEVDLVSHSGNWADGEYLQSLNLTDIQTGWVESYAVLGKTQRRVGAAVAVLHAAVPFALRGLDSDNGSEFINASLWQYCRGRQIHFTRGRPYKKDDNAHVEQKNWTHVRKLVGWDRYDSLEAQAAINDLYRNELRLMMNLFQPSVKLVRKTRVGAQLRRRYDRPQTPLDRLLASGAGDPDRVRALQRLRARLDPFALAAAIDRKLQRIYRLANRRHSPRAIAVSPRFLPPLHRWDHDWLFRSAPSRQSPPTAPVRT
ncbi:MAG: integrase [bacterium]